MPYVQRKKVKLKLPSSQQRLYIIDGFYVDIVYIPAICTGELQPLDLSINKAVNNITVPSFPSSQ